MCHDWCVDVLMGVVLMSVMMGVVWFAVDVLFGELSFMYGVLGGHTYFACIVCMYAYYA